MGISGKPLLPRAGEVNEMSALIRLPLSGNYRKPGDFDGVHLGGVCAPIPAADIAGCLLTLETRSKELTLTAAGTC